MAYCSSCGTQLQSDVQFCSSCGTSMQTSAKGDSYKGSSSSQQFQMNLVNAFKRVVFENYANFNGRASKSEYWWYILASIILSVGATIIDAILGTSFVNSILSLALLVPGIAVAARRLHDTNRSGWWQLIALTIIGIIPLIIWLVQASDKTENNFGSTPTV